MQKEKAHSIYLEVKQSKGRKPFIEDIHCTMMFQALGRMSKFCVMANVSDQQVYKWLRNSELFKECYALAKMYGQEEWEEEGLQIRDEEVEPGVCNYRYEHWKMMGWSRYGIGKNARICLELDPNSTADQHYKQVIKQAANGAFSTTELKQIMESLNVGLNVQQVINMQKQIDQLNADLITMAENKNGDDRISA